MLILSHTYTHHTHTLQIHALLVMGWLNEKKENDISACRREEVGFSSDLKEESEEECLTERGREFQITGPIH